MAIAMALIRRIGSVRCGDSVESRAIDSEYAHEGRTKDVAEVTEMSLLMGEWQKGRFLGSFLRHYMRCGTWR
jgi:hypothetical protein